MWHHLEVGLSSSFDLLDCLAATLDCLAATLDRLDCLAATLDCRSGAILDCLAATSCRLDAILRSELHAVERQSLEVQVVELHPWLSMVLSSEPSMVVSSREKPGS